MSERKSGWNIGWHEGRNLDDFDNIGGPNFIPYQDYESYRGNGDEKPKPRDIGLIGMAVIRYFDGNDFLTEKPVPETA